MNTNDFFIDIRNSDEVLSHKFDNTKHKFVNIPANMIRFNLDFLRDLVKSEEYERIFLVCNSGNRSKIIYNKYFVNDNILKNIIIDNRVAFNKFITSNPYNINELNLSIYTLRGPKFNLYNMTRVIQLLLGSILLIGGLKLINTNKKNEWIIWIMIGFGLMAIFNALTATCTISKVFAYYLN
jgi:rhodanese-related sulfurtransferase